MSQERPIREWYDLLPEPLRTEANAARDRAEARGDNAYSRCKTAYDLAEAIYGFDWYVDGGDFDKWERIHDRAVAGEFDGPSEADRLRARVAELEKELQSVLDWHKEEKTPLRPIELNSIRSILNKK